MPRWNEQGQNGKGSDDRVDLKKYFKNYDEIDWGKKKKPQIKDDRESI